jgi:hypothetical protein
MATAWADITDFLGLVRQSPGRRSPAQAATINTDATNPAATLGC